MKRLLSLSLVFMIVLLALLLFNSDSHANDDCNWMVSLDPIGREMQLTSFCVDTMSAMNIDLYINNEYHQSYYVPPLGWGASTILYVGYSDSINTWRIIHSGEIIYEWPIHTPTPTPNVPPVSTYMPTVGPPDNPDPPPMSTLLPTIVPTTPTTFILPTEAPVTTEMPTLECHTRGREEICLIN